MNVIFIIFLIGIYACIGIFITIITEAVRDSNPIFFGKTFDALEENNKTILERTFWPFFLLYLIGWCIIWYITHLIIAIKSLFKSINIKK